jgi:hypothetical protein
MTEYEIINASAQCLVCGQQRVTDPAKIRQLMDDAHHAVDLNARCEGIHGNPHRR